MQWKEKETRDNSLECSRIFRAHGSPLEVLQFLSELSPVGKYISYIFLLCLVPCFTYLVPYCATFIQSELLYLSLTLQKLSIKFHISLRQGYFVYQLSEVRDCLFLWVSTVFNKKRPNCHRFILCDQNTNKPFPGFCPRHSFFAQSMYVIIPWIPPSIG